MMKYILFFLLFSINVFALEIGEDAPNFKLVNQQGKEISLSSFKGKTVILEWLNHGCPFVRKHYDSGNMQRTQKHAKKNEFVWLSIISSAPGKQGHVDTEQAQADKEKNKSLADHVLLDPTGSTGLAYTAQTTPHLFIVSDDGKLVYQGGIDSIASADPSDIAKAENFIDRAMKEIKTGKKITKAKTKNYGCSVKY